MDLVIGFIYAVMASVLTFIQLQGNLKYHLYEKYPVWLLAAAVPISWLFIKSVERFTAWFNGEIWPTRFLGFAIGIIVFAIMSNLMFKEPLTLKTIVCILLATAIMLTQLFWK
jgi:hypothetical protein